MHVVALFHPKAKRWVDGRKGLLLRLSNELPGSTEGRPVAWFHAASLGEFEQGRPVMEAFQKNYPGYAILLTFFSPSGYEVRKNYAVADYVCYLPLDTAVNARKFVRLVNPRIAFFIKYEFWYHYLHELRLQKASIVSFASIFRPTQPFFRFYGQLHRTMLRYFDHIVVQNGESERLLAGIGISSVSCAGDTRFDRVHQIAQAARSLPLIEAFVGQVPCLVVGSAWEADMKVLIEVLNGLEQPLKVIIAPHEIHDAELEQWAKRLRLKTARYSAYTAADVSADCLFIDNVGMLSSLYRYGQMAYIGGAFGAGLHNILEAATFGLPVFFGNKNYRKFQEAVDLTEAGGALAVSDASELGKAMVRLLTDSALRAEKGNLNRQYVQARTGATEQVMQVVHRLLS